ncbi:hypothetical protein N658DRAFT_101041 [Parathielavia hyrcaniae]|uniref:Uncharacterized protein n=1 Tax=Parathielavia hyrcaniae TaxID=113614 RepID=A0AAN6T190_9PEZI|nr:hypothetical protein N658DRAFT_101041 [Parathielavia hyrcaniae]
MSILPSHTANSDPGRMQSVRALMKVRTRNDVPYITRELPPTFRDILAPLGSGVITCSRSPPCQPLTTDPSRPYFSSACCLKPIPGPTRARHLRCSSIRGPVLTLKLLDSHVRLFQSDFLDIPAHYRFKCSHPVLDISHTLLGSPHPHREVQLSEVCVLRACVSLFHSTHSLCSADPKHTIAGFSPVRGPPTRQTEAALGGICRVPA